MVSVKNIARKSIWLAWTVLSVGLIATIVAAIYVKMNVEADVKREFAFACNQIQLRIDARMAAHKQILMSAAALFDASDEVTREEWHAYTRKQKVEQLLPGIQGIGFSQVIPREQLEEHIQKIRSHGFPDYNVIPDRMNDLMQGMLKGWDLEAKKQIHLQLFDNDQFRFIHVFCLQ